MVRGIRLRRNLAVLTFIGVLAQGQNSGTGTVQGKVALEANGMALHNATVYLSPSGRSLQTNEEGWFSFAGVAPGAYTVMAHMHSLTDAQRRVLVSAGQAVRVDFALKLSPVRESVTVTAEGREIATADALQTVTSLEGFELTTRAQSASLGDILENETGIAKRSGGPGTTRPVVRGFDGDRVLVLQDGVRTGTLSSQSGDHGEPVDATAVDRVEVVRGPATLLYGSNAIGGVVNVLTGHHILHEHPHEGIHVTVTGLGGTANAQGGGSGQFEFGKGHWLYHAAAGGQRTGDYKTPLGAVLNSDSELKHGGGGAGRFGEKFSFNANYLHQSGFYGVPYAGEDEHEQHEIPTSLARELRRSALLRPLGEEEEGHEHEGPVGLDWRRHNLRGNMAFKQLGGGFEQFQLALNYSDWNHNEIELAENLVGTRFYNKQFIYRGTLTQKKRGIWGGSLGFWGMARNFEALGAEALAPPVDQNAFAVFGLQELTLENLKLQFGARYERNAYSPDGLVSRTFNGVSASAGAAIPLWTGGTFLANYMHSYRAPALEELYNHGPHPGNGIYEIGDSTLRRELGDSLEISLRQRSRRFRGEVQLFRYQMHDFVYFNPTGEFEDGLPVAEYKQADARFLGAEAKTEFNLYQPLWLTLGFDAVDANLTAAGRANLPRIPPVRGRAGLSWSWRSLTVKPELVMANRQWQSALNETETAGYAVVHLTAMYTITRQHCLHTLQATTFNLGDRLYRNHLSLIKQFAPEIGRGVRFSYTLNWF
jgi:iron complex outermembrane receptor protein